MVPPRSLPALLLTALGIVLLLAAGCGRDTAPPVRLLEAEPGAGAEVAGPTPAVAPIGEGPAAIAGPPWPERVGQTAMTGELGWDARVALLGGDGTTYRFPVELPRHPVLRVGLGFQPPPRRGDSPPPPGEVRHRVRVLTRGGGSDDGTTVLDERWRPAAGGAWRDLEIDLGEWAGESVVLELATGLDGTPDGSAAAWSAPEVVSLPGGGEEGWDLLFVSLDTLRADRLGSYGHDRPTSPALDALAGRGVRFAAAVAQAPWTRPSHRSMLTGLYPVSNGGLESPLLAEVLWRAGYRTTAITGGGQIAPRFGFDAGFESYRIDRWEEEPGRVVRAFEANRGRRQLVFLHTYRVHDPYRGDAFGEGLPRGRLGDTFGEHDWRRFDHELTEEERHYVSALYDSGVAAVDRAVGAVIGGLEEAGFLDRTIVVVTSDHGEQLWEHGSWRHGQNLYDEQILVPLLLYLPPGLARELGVEPGTVIERQVELVDLYPTLLDLLGVERQHPVQGRSLLPLLTGGDWTPREAFSEHTNIKTWERKAFRSDRFKFVKSVPRPSRRTRGATPYFELYDLRRDPGEHDDLSQRHPEVIERLDERLHALGASLRGLEDELPEDLDPELKKQLEALGYLGD
jgi:arylsulfatase A-like enzyme